MGGGGVESGEREGEQRGGRRIEGLWNREKGMRNREGARRNREEGGGL